MPGRGPVAIERLGSGLVNESYRVLRDGSRYSLRVTVPDAVQLGIDRDWEYRVLERASAARLAPRVERWEPRQGILVTRWVEGRVWSEDEARLTANIAKVALLARRVHALSPPAPPRILSPADWTAHYRGACARLSAEPERPGTAGGRGCDLAERLDADLERHLAAIGPPRPTLVLCHSDLHVANIVAADPDELVLLDWEYAHVSEALWDLAGWACNNDLSPEARTFLMASYFGRPPAGEEEQRLEHLCWLYDYICLLWSEVYLGSRGGEAKQAIMRRARVLTARLARGAGGGGD